MLVDELQAKGVRLSVNGDMLEFDCDEPITEQMLKTLKSNKLQLIAEILVNSLVEVVDDDVFPRHRFKAEQMPKPKMTDLAWLHEMLGTIPNRLEVAAEYSRIYKQEFESESIEIKKDNTARNAANTWLRELNEKPMH